MSVCLFVRLFVRLIVRSSVRLSLCPSITITHPTWRMHGFVSLRKPENIPCSSSVNLFFLRALVDHFTYTSPCLPRIFASPEDLSLTMEKTTRRKECRFLLWTGILMSKTKRPSRSRMAKLKSAFVKSGTPVLCYRENHGRAHFNFRWQSCTGTRGHEFISCSGKSFLRFFLQGHNYPRTRPHRGWLLRGSSYQVITFYNLLNTKLINGPPGEVVSLRTFGPSKSSFAYQLQGGSATRNVVEITVERCRCVVWCLGRTELLVLLTNDSTGLLGEVREQNPTVTLAHISWQLNLCSGSRS